MSEALYEELIDATHGEVERLPPVSILVSTGRDLTHDQCGDQLSAELRRLLQHDFVRTIAVAMQLADELNSTRAFRLILDCPIGFHGMSDRTALAGMVASLLTKDGRRNVLAALGTRRQTDAQPALASIAVRFGDSWRPQPVRRPFLNNAILTGVDWDRADLRQYELVSADFRKARMNGCLLQRACAVGANFTGAQLAAGKLQKVNAASASFCFADLRGADAREGIFDAANLSDVIAMDCCFKGASLKGASLTRGNFSGTVWRSANLTGASLTDADFSDGVFAFACLRHVDLRSVNLVGTQFPTADLTGACMEGVFLLGADLRSARLDGANLTDAAFPGGRFLRARFVHAYLAGVDFSNADLRCANFHNATFHMGSSRSGLVGSDLASEGTRTGFYSNDYDDPMYRQPEEIRVANLCHCDLRDAHVSETDFWRVDLRGAVYTDDQRQHFLATGAILS